MKSIIRVFGFLILIAALAGGVYLAGKNQETRRGAAANDTVISFLPETGTFDKGKKVPVSVWVDTGKTTDTMTGAELQVSFDRSTLAYDSYEMLTTKYSLLQESNNEIDGGRGPLNFTLVALGGEQGGAVNLMKINFKSLNDGVAKVSLASGNILVKGQTATWSINKINSASYKIGKGGTKPTATPTGKKPTNTPTLRPTSTPMTTPVQMSCGKRCYNDKGCTGGLTCVPLWWPCPRLPDALKTKLQGDISLNPADIDEVMRICPEAKDKLDGGLKKIPLFYGVCRNPACVGNPTCQCAVRPTLTPTVVPTVTPTAKPTVPPSTIRSDLFIWEKLDGKSSYLVGDVARIALEFNVPPLPGGGVQQPGKVSAINAHVAFDKTLMQAIEVTIDNPVFNNILKKEIDNSNGLVWISISSSKPTGELISGISAATIKFKMLKSGRGMINVSKVHPVEMVGVDYTGKSIAFSPIVIGEDKYVQINNVITCQVCAVGLPPKTKGNANCDSKIDLLDFEYWRNEAFDKGGMGGVISNNWASDFTCDTRADLLDFETWRFTVFP